MIIFKKKKKQQRQQIILHLLSLNTLSKTEKDVIALKIYNSEINEQFDNCPNVMKNDEQKHLDHFQPFYIN